MDKRDVRAIAAELALVNAAKPDSQDICFVPSGHYNSIVDRVRPDAARPGDIVDASGTVLGRHDGITHFTVGQRRGLGVAATQPLYVNATDSVANSVTVGPREDLAAERVAVIDVVMHRDGARVDCVRLRYRSPAVPASVEAPAGRHDFLEIELGEPFDGVAPGQTAVMMSGDTVVGHGTIK